MSYHKWIVGACLSLVALTSGVSAKETMRLEWVIQGQFAGPLLALDKGYYKDAGIEMELLPAGPLTQRSHPQLSRSHDAPSSAQAD